MIQKVGKENITHVSTHSVAPYVYVNAILEKYKKIVWDPCTAHCINSMLKDIRDLLVHRDTVEMAMKNTVFIYWVLNLMRFYTKEKIDRADRHEIYNQLPHPKLD